MSTVSRTPLGHHLKELLDSWKKQFPKRASGGGWALAGFAFQTSVYLLRFFQRLEGTAEPGLLSEMEHLSDIICPSDGKLILIQVKRTLTRHALISAVEEAYLITDLCRRETPILLDHVRFQVACKKRETITGVADLSMSEVVGSGGNVESWNAMLSRFDVVTPIAEEPDALNQLHIFLWNAGIKNTTALIERCVGRLLMSFGTNDPTALRQVGRELVDCFFAAERHAVWEPIGRLLTSEDIATDPKASQFTGILTGQTPRLEHLTKGFFRDRPHIFQELWQTFRLWISSLEALNRSDDDKVPVFWIDGRSGEGKSILLLQLVAEALRSSIISPLIQLKEGDDVPRLMITVPDREQLSQHSFSRIFAVVDDIYDLHTHDRDEWDATILSECDYRTPPIAIITCGPTEQREQCVARLSGAFQVTHFEIPLLDINEFQSFLTWYESRTGQVRQGSELTTENPLLVQLMFELAHGERMPEFARRFRKRLSDLEIFDVSRAILAVNALYMDAPLSLLTTDQGRDALEYLCKDEQLHFHVRPSDGPRSGGVRLAHPHLAWLLFIEWVEPSPSTLAKGWARELFKSMTILDDGSNTMMVDTLLYRLLHTTRLSDVDGSPCSPVPAANRHELIRELYRLHIAQHGGGPSPLTLSRWLEFEYESRGLQLVPDPAQCAIAILSDATLAPSVHGRAAIWLWLVTELRKPQQAQQIRDAVKDFCLRYSDNPGISYALVTLFAKQRNSTTIREFCIDWLANNLTNLKGHELITPLVAASPSDARVRTLAFDWLAINETHPWASNLIATLVAASPTDVRARTLAFDWLTTNETHSQVSPLIATLVAASPTDVRVRTLAFDWLGANGTQPQVSHLIVALVAASPTDARVRALAFDWLAANETHKQANNLIAALVAANPNDEEIRTHATTWLTNNETHPEFHWLLRALVAANPSDSAVKAHALAWLASNETHSQVYQVIVTLVAAHREDPEVRKLVLDWLTANEGHPNMLFVLKTLIAAVPNDPEVMVRAADWLRVNESHPSYYQLLNVMIARTDGSKEWLDLGEQYVKKSGSAHTQFILGVLLTAGKADPKFIEMAFDFMEDTTNKRHRNFVLFHLSRALVYHFNNAVQYLNGTYDPQRKKSVCASISVGMNRSPDTIAAFVLDVVSCLAPDDLYRILWNVIKRRLEVDYLDDLIVQWLVDNYHRRGYRGMLDILHSNPAIWERLLPLGNLPKKIVKDFNTQFR